MATRRIELVLILLATSGCKLLARKHHEGPSWDAGPAFTIGDPPVVDAGDARIIVVEIAPDGSLRVDGTVVRGTSDVTARAAAARATTANVEAHIHAAPEAPYARVVEVMDAMRSAGVTRVSVGGEPGAPF